MAHPWGSVFSLLTLHISILISYKLPDITDHRFERKAAMTLDTKRRLLTSLMMAATIASALTGLFSGLATGFGAGWLPAWGQNFLIAWPSAFVISVLAGPVLQRIAARVLGAQAAPH
ncbi:MAG: hypothetical protein CSA72_07895 [Rhodobacterales bacterium]|nr:MAG: hypothetical protein CSA72_07895 [Rhodobacterales bacterium]